MQEKIKELLKDKFIKNICIANVFILFIFVMVLLIKWKNLEVQLPLYYSLPRSEEQLGTPVMLLILPGASLICFIINFSIALRLYTREILCTYLLFSSSLIVSSLLLITFLRIVFLIS
jgi:hypothetical protein